MYVGAERLRRGGGHRQRPHHTVDLRKPGVGCDQDAHSGGRALVSTRGDDRHSVSAQVMISNRPSSCSASAVQRSTQSPQFM